MTYGNYMNMEKLSLEIAEENINKMSESNYQAELPEFVDADEFTKNLKYGYIVVTMLSSYIESSINTILRESINYSDENLLKNNINDKFDIIFLCNGKSFSNVKSNNLYGEFKKMTSIRNDMIHYKYNYIGDGNSIPTSGNSKNPISKRNLQEYFTKSNMMKVKKNTIDFLQLICTELNIQINNVKILEGDAKGTPYNYLSKSITNKG